MEAIVRSRFSRMPKRTPSYLAGIVGGSLFVFGLLTIFSLVGIPFLIAGAVLVALSLGSLHGSGRLMAGGAALTAAVMTGAFLAWGAEHVWAQPSCSGQINQVSGSIDYWSGATVKWRCDNGQPGILRDTR